MKSFNLVLILMCLNFVVKAQDTLTLKSGAKIPAKVLEVNPTSVKYKHFNNITGPDYVEDKANILTIKYGNGSVDSFKVETTTTPIVSSGQPTVTIGKITEPSKKANASFNKIIQVDNKYYFATENNDRLPRAIGISKIMRTARSLCVQKPSPALEESIKRTRQCKIRQTVFGITGAPLMLVGFISSVSALYVISGGYSTTDSNGATAFGVLGGTFLATGITFEIISGINNNKKKKHLKETVDLYNQNL